MADNLNSFAKLVEEVMEHNPFKAKATKRPYFLRKRRSRRLDRVAKQQRKLNRSSRKNRDLRTPPRERRS